MDASEFSAASAAARTFRRCTLCVRSFRTFHLVQSLAQEPGFQQIRRVRSFGIGDVIGCVQLRKLLTRSPELVTADFAALPGFILIREPARIRVIGFVNLTFHARKQFAAVPRTIVGKTSRNMLDYFDFF